MNAPRVIGWRVWYDDLSVYDSRATDWEALPSDGVQVVMLYQSDGGSQQIASYDFYFNAGDIYGGNNDPPEVTQERYGITGASIKRGRWTDTERIHDLIATASESSWVT